MNSMGTLQLTRSGIFKNLQFCLYNALPKRSKICVDQLNEDKGLKNTTCVSQVIALHDKPTTKVSHIIIDMDGVVLDSNIYNTIAHEEYLMKWKKPLRPNIRYQIMGMRNVDAGNIVTYEYDMPFNGDVYAHGVWQIQRGLLHQAKMVKGIDDLVCYFIGQKMPLALISSGHTKAFRILLGRLKGFHRHFCHIVHGDQLLKGKPDPEIYVRAAKLFHKGPEDLKKYLVIDGSHSGVLAARAVGMQSILIADRSMPKKLRDDATAVLYDVRDFDPTEFHMPEIKKVPRH